MRTRGTFVVAQHISTIIKSETHEVEALPPHHLAAAATTGWKSPVPYLFGGLAAMLGLIAFALLILACSYWKLSGYLDAGENSGDEAGERKVVEEMPAAVFPNSILVIMAGEEKPTFLATPATSRATSFGDSVESKGSCSSSSGSDDDDDCGGDEERREKELELTTTRTTITTPEEEKS